jgi:hypothetical protein
MSHGPATQDLWLTLFVAVDARVCAPNTHSVEN